MAFSVRITGYAKSGEVLFEFEPGWWSSDELKRNSRFAMSNDTGSYFDYDADFSLDDAIALHEHIKPHTLTGLYAMPGWREKIAPQMAQLEDTLYTHASSFSCLHVNVFEWESGLG